MADGLVEKATRKVTGLGGAVVAGGLALEGAGFLGNAFYYAGTESTQGSQTMLAHVGVAMSNHNPFGKDNGFLDMAGQNALSGLYIAGVLATIWTGKKIVNYFSQPHQ